MSRYLLPVLCLLLPFCIMGQRVGIDFISSDGLNTKQVSSKATMSTLGDDSVMPYHFPDYDTEVSNNPCDSINIQLSSTITNESCMGNDGAIVVIAGGGAIPYSYMWSNGANTEGFGNAIANTYSVTVTDANGCTATGLFTINRDCNDPCANVNIVINENITASTCSDNDGAISVEATGGNTPYTYQWSNGDAGSDISGLQSGNYTVTATDANGCAQVKEITVSQNCSTESTCPDDQIMFMMKRWEGTFTQFNINETYPMIMEITQVQDGAFSGTINWPTLRNSITTCEGYCSNDTIYFTELELLQGSNIELNGTYVVTPENQASATIQGGYFSPGSSTLDGTFDLVDAAAEGERICIGNVQGASGVEVLVPVVAKGFSNGLGSLQGLLQLSDETVGQILDVEGGVIGDMVVFNANSGSLSFFSFNPLDLGDSTLLFNVRVSLTGTENTSANLTITGSEDIELQFSDNDAFDINPTIENGAIQVEGPQIVIGEQIGKTGEIVLVPVVGQNLFSEVVSLQGELLILDPNVGEIAGIQTDKFNSPLLNLDNGRFSMTADPDSVSFFGEADTLFFIEILLTGENGDSSDVALIDGTGTPFQLGIRLDGNFVTELDGVILVDGKIRIKNTVRVAGQINTHWGVPMPEVRVSLDGDGEEGLIQEITSTDLIGQYAFEEVPIGANIEVTPAKDTNAANGVRSVELFVAQNFIVGNPLPAPFDISSPYQVMAADANCNGLFQSNDLFIIQEVLVGNFGSFQNERYGYDCPSWRFVPVEEDSNFILSARYHTNYEELQFNTAMINVQDSVTADFRGVKVGDIFNTANPARLWNGEPLQLDPTKESGTVDIMTQPFYNPTSNILTYNFILAHDVNSVAYQFSLGFDNEGMRFIEATKGITEPAIGGKDIGVLNFSWFSITGNAMPMEEGSTLFSLQFEVTDINNIPENSLWVNNNGLTAALHDAQLNPLNISLFNAQTTSTTGLFDITDQIELYQNQPNPFSQQTQIGFYLPESMEVELIITDVMGKVLWRKANVYGKGEHKEEISLDLPSGMYSYSLRTNRTIKTKTMIVNK